VRKFGERGSPGAPCASSGALSDRESAGLPVTPSTGPPMSERPLQQGLVLPEGAALGLPGQRERRDGRAALPRLDLRQGASAGRVTSAGVSLRPKASKSRFWTVDRKFSGFGLSSNALAIW
jgi:hypothetical protein